MAYNSKIQKKRKFENKMMKVKSCKYKQKES